MKSYWIITILLFVSIDVLQGQISPSININEKTILHQDSIILKKIEQKQKHWQKKIEELKSLGRKPKIGLVLSGGGAKGFAHIAVLKKLEQYNISLDYIGGTSVGALVGSLYAIGYTAQQIDSIFRIIDFTNFFKDEYLRIEKPFMDKINNSDKYLLSLPFSKKGIVLPISYSKGQKLTDEITRLIKLKAPTTHDFSKFPIPFFCVATNLTTGTEKIFDHGYLIEPLLASMALPSLFSPVLINDTLFVDGGIVNNLPTDEMKRRDMDLIIAVDISDHVEKPMVNSIITYIDYLFSLMIKNNVSNQIKFADILIKPEVNQFSSISFSDKDSIYEQGIKATILYENEFNDIANLCNQYNTTKIPKTPSTDLPNNFLIKQLDILGSLDSFVISKKEKVKLSSIEQSIKRLYSTGFYNKIYYTLDTIDKDSYKLNLHLDESPYNSFLKLGIHYDNLYSIGLLVNYTLRKKFLSNQWVRQIDLSVDGVASNLYRGELRYFQRNKIIPNFGLNSYYAFLNPSIYTSVNQQDAAFRTVNMQLFHTEFYLNYIVKQLFAINAGIEAQYASFRTSTNPLSYWYNGWNYNLLGSLMVDTRNNISFPSSGLFLHGEYKLIPLKLINDFEIAHFLKASIDGYIPIFKDIFSVGLGASGGYLSANIPNYMFSIGGTNSQYYFNNDQFAGYNYASFFTTFYLKGQFGFLVRFYKKHYLQAICNVMNSLRQNVLTGIPRNFNDFDFHYGFGVGYGWESPIGTIKLSYNYAPSATNFIYEKNASNGIFFISIGHVF